MQFNAQDFASLREAFLAADAVKDSGGSTIYAPGGPAYSGYELDLVTPLRLPRNTNFFGDGESTTVNGKIVVGSVTGNNYVGNMALPDGITVDGARGYVLMQLSLASTMSFTGPSFYNTVNTCQFLVTGATPAIDTVDNDQNQNRVVGCRINYELMGIDLSCGDTGPFTNGWTIEGTGLEGAGADDAALGPAVALNGRGHNVRGCWGERGGSRFWPIGSYWIELRAGSNRCEIGNNRGDFLVRVNDAGTYNYVHGEFVPDVRGGTTFDYFESITTEANGSITYRYD